MISYKLRLGQFQLHFIYKKPGQKIAIFGHLRFFDVSSHIKWTLYSPRTTVFFSPLPVIKTYQNTQKKFLNLISSFLIDSLCSWFKKVFLDSAALRKFKFAVYVCIFFYQTFTLWLYSNMNKVYFSHTFPKGIFDDGVFPIC